jgi:hypothetical protein
MRLTDEKKPKKRNQKITVIILSLLGLCLLTAGISVISNQFLPKASETPDKLSQKDLAHAEEALHLMAELGEQTWHGLSGNIPLLLWNDDYAFLTNSQKQLAGWDRLENAMVNDLSVYVQENEANYQAFTEILPGGRYAGSMATKNATNIGFINLFRENLPPVVSKIFPYRLLLLSTDHYITALVHESFHAYQAENYPERFKDAEKAYPSTDAYEEIFPEMSEDWQKEIQLLIDANQEQDRVNQIGLIRDFLEVRENRRTNAGLTANLELYEKRYEWLEGSAKYVELDIWKNAANSPEYQPVEEISIDRDFDGYQGYQKRWNNELTSMKNAAKNIGDSLFYYTGMLQGRLLDSLMPDWKLKIGEPGVWYEDLLKEAVN